MPYLHTLIMKLWFRLDTEDTASGLDQDERD